MLRPLGELFSPSDYPDLLIGLGEPDDAAVWQLDEQRALVVTTDFFTPVVDDPYDYGAIAAANSLSDVYAMGGQPFLALNLAALPPDLPAEMTREIMRGGAEMARQAGVVIAGGHTVQDKEPKYGLVVLGLVHPERIMRKGGALAGDALVLTKPLGTGVLATAHKRDKILPEELDEAVRWMKRLNREAAALAVELELRAVTDVTGFGLLGHAAEMAAASGAAIHIDPGRVPWMTGVRRCADQWIFPSGTTSNREHFGLRVRFDPALDEASQMLLFDAQTSGGLLMAVPPDKLARLQARAAEIEQPLWVIGDVAPGDGIDVH